METSTSVASNNENGEEVEASEITHAPDVTRNGLTGINDTSPKCKDFAQIFLDRLSNMPGDYDEVRLVDIRQIYQHLSQRTNEKKTDKGEINILPSQGHYRYPEVFSEGFPL